MTSAAIPLRITGTEVVGHTPQTTGEILDLGFVIGIDTDCSRGNCLTAMDITSGRYWQVSQRGELRTRQREIKHP
jgi:serine/threonine protein phosphatase 1